MKGSCILYYDTKFKVETNLGQVLLKSMLKELQKEELIEIYKERFTCKELFRLNKDVIESFDRKIFWRI